MFEQWTAPTSEREARIELAVAYRMAADLGWTDLGSTHFSMRVPGEPDAYLLLRQGLFFEEVTASNIIKIGLDGTVRTPGAEVNPAGVTIHSALLAARPDLGSVMHTHTRAGIAATCHPEGLLPLSQHSMRFYEHQGTHDYEGVALDNSEGPRLVKALDDHELLLLRNHGLLTVGPSIPQAFSAMYYAELSCRIQVDTLATTTDPILPAPDVCRHTYEQYAGIGYQFRDWLGIVRQVERNHPNYAD